MKTLLIFLLSIITISANCQIFKTTGPDLQPQLTQLQKTNDSLKTIVVNLKSFIVKYKQDSVNYYAWAGVKNAQMKLKMDSISVLKITVKTKSDSIALLKTQIKPVVLQKTVDSLKTVNSNLQLLYAKCRYQIFSDTIDVIGFSDTIVGIYTKISERTYEVTPKFTLQVLQRYPIKIGTAIKTKEVTVTELNQ